jgi:hypothetical protein
MVMSKSGIKVGVTFDKGNCGCPTREELSYLSAYEYNCPIHGKMMIYGKDHWLGD